MIRAIIFDFDGLMMETENGVYQSWQEIFAEHGGDLPLDTWVSSIGSTDAFDPYDYLSTQTGRAVDRDAIQLRFRQRADELVAGQDLLPGVSAYIEEAVEIGLLIAVASSSARQWVHGHLGRHGLVERFDCIRCSDDVRRTKPDPELFLSVLDRLQLAPAEAIVLEDSANGVRAAKAAGIFCVAIPGPLTSHLAFEDADLRLGSLAELPLRELIAFAEQVQASR